MKSKHNFGFLSQSSSFWPVLSVFSVYIAVHAAVPMIDWSITHAGKQQASAPVCIIYQAILAKNFEIYKCIIRRNLRINWVRYGA